MRFIGDSISGFKRWFGKIAKRWWMHMICRHRVSADDIPDLDLIAIRGWILQNIDDPHRNMCISLLLYRDTVYLGGGFFRFRHREDALAFRLRWCD